MILHSRRQTSSQWSVLSGTPQVQYIKLYAQLKFAQNPETRRIAYSKHENRLTINDPLLSKALDLRRKIAKLLKYETWADYITEVKMVKSARGVTEVRILRL